MMILYCIRFSLSHIVRAQGRKRQGMVSRLDAFNSPRMLGGGLFVIFKQAPFFFCRVYRRGPFGALI